MTKTFGQIIAAARKDREISQKELATRILKEDGRPISPQYLNDIEHDRRNPPGEFIIVQLAENLNLPQEHLIAVAGMLPSSLRDSLPRDDPERVEKAFRAFRRELKRKS